MEFFFFLETKQKKETNWCLRKIDIVEHNWRRNETWARIYFHERIKICNSVNRSERMYNPRRRDKYIFLMV